jgi:hypothetical protein
LVARKWDYSHRRKKNLRWSKVVPPFECQAPRQT